MADGSLPRAATPLNVASDGIAADHSVMMTDLFWKYDRNQRRLWMPDFSRIQFDTVTGEVERPIFNYMDAFGNLTTFTRSGAQLAVSQHLAAGQVRTVVITMDSGGFPLTMAFAGSEWRYRRDGSGLVDVEPPAGPGWHFAYGPGIPSTSLTMTTPQGGQVQYLYKREVFATSDPGVTRSTTRLS